MASLLGPLALAGSLGTGVFLAYRYNPDLTRNGTTDVGHAFHR